MRLVETKTEPDPDFGSVSSPDSDRDIPCLDSVVISANCRSLMLFTRVLHILRLAAFIFLAIS